MIYDLANAGGGTIITDANSGGPALRLNSNVAAQPALSILSTASGAAVVVTAISGGAGIQARSADGTFAAGDFRSNVSSGPALVVGRTVNGSNTIAAMQFLGTSVASGALINFAGGFISLTSTVLTTVANTDYAIPVQVGLEVRYIPLFKAAALIGAATF